MQHSPERPALPRIGLVTSDALRVLGLQTILRDGEACEVFQLEGLDRQERSVHLVVIDATTTEHVLELVAEFHRLRPGIGLLVLGANANPDYIARIISTGALGYLNLAASEAEVQMAIDVVLDGSIWAPRKVLAKLLQSARKESADPGPELVTFTRREREVLRLLVKGHPNREIAALLGVDEVTIKAHMGRLMRKAGVDNRTALSMRALERHWISQDN